MATKGDHPADSPSPADFTALLRPAFAGRRHLLALGPAAAATAAARELRELGAAPSLVLAQGPGTGAPPDPEDATVVDVRSGPTPHGMVMKMLRHYDACLAAPSPEVLAAIEAYDPRGEARVLGAHSCDAGAVAGRPRYARRPEAWARLEDKCVIDAVWDDVGVPRAPCEVLPARSDAILAAVRRLDQGAGVVLSGDNREGWNGGANYVRRLRAASDVAMVAPFFERRCDRVRVMPFLEGVPCSIHGVVLPDGVAAFRPVEMVCFQRSGRHDLLYAGVATSYDPPGDVREAMRDVARRVGAHLRTRVGYRGGFTIDGVATAAGFLPTELNARAGAGLVPIAAARPELYLLRLVEAITEGERLDIDASELEHLVVTAADRRRARHAWAFLTDELTDTPRRVALRAGPGAELWPAEDGEAEDAALTLGPAAGGSLVRFDASEQAVPAGASFAPWAAAAFSLADSLFGTRFGGLIPATVAGAAVAAPGR